MGMRKMKLSSIFKGRSDSKKPWEWSPPCGHHPKTHSFRVVGGASDHPINIFNTLFFDSPAAEYSAPESPSATATATAIAFSTDSPDSLETLVRGARSERRLFFHPEDTRSLILEDQEYYSKITPNYDSKAVGYKESCCCLVVSMESDNPYSDFRRSMEEMVESHGVREWEALEELLKCYLNVNANKNHAFILGAFVDVLVDIFVKSSSSSSSSSSYNSAYYSCMDSASNSSSSSSFLERSVRTAGD